MHCLEDFMLVACLSYLTTLDLLFGSDITVGYGVGHINSWTVVNKSPVYGFTILS